MDENRSGPRGGCQGYQKLLYSMSKAYKTRSSEKSKNTTLKTATGEIITGPKNVANRWAEYFQDLLNVDVEGNRDERSCVDSSIATHNIPDQDDPILMDEIEAVLKLTIKKLLDQT